MKEQCQEALQNFIAAAQKLESVLCDAADDDDQGVSFAANFALDRFGSISSLDDVISEAQIGLNSFDEDFNNDDVDEDEK